MMEHEDRHPNTESDLDAWLDAVDALASGNHNTRTFPADRPLAHVTGPSGDLVIRQWPVDASVEGIGFVASVLDAVHGAAGDVIPPIHPAPGDPESRTVTVKDRLYSRSPFMGGHPLGRYGSFKAPDGRTINIPLPESAKANAVIADLARIVALTHSATGDVASAPGAPVHTVNDFLEEVRKSWFVQRKTLGDRAAEQRDIRRWLRCGNRVIPTASDLLRNEQAIMADRSVVNHGDLWPVNVLVEGRDESRTITGVVGWSHAAAGSPVLDIAALTVHMQGWSAALTEAIIDAYSSARRLLPEERRIIPAVAALDLVAHLADLLTLAYLDDRMIGHPAAPVLRSGMKTLLNSLETLTRILAPDIEQTNRFTRWTNGRPPIGGGPRRFSREGDGRGAGRGSRGTRPGGRPVSPRSKQRRPGERDK